MRMSIGVLVLVWALTGNGLAQEIFSDGFEGGQLLVWSDLAAPCTIPSGAGVEDVSNPTTVVGAGTPGSCTSAAFVSAVAQGGIITFDCGPDPVTITLSATAKIFNDTGPEIVIDGGGLVTLSGENSRRILYMNTCDPDQVWTTDHCQNQDHPRLTVQNLTFVNADSRSETMYDGGGAIYNDGNTTTLSICGSRIEFNEVNAYGSAIFSFRTTTRAIS